MKSHRVKCCLKSSNAVFIAGQSRAHGPQSRSLAGVSPAVATLIIGSLCKKRGQSYRIPALACKVQPAHWRLNVVRNWDRWFLACLLVWDYPNTFYSFPLVALVVSSRICIAFRNFSPSFGQANCVAKV